MKPNLIQHENSRRIVMLVAFKIFHTVIWFIMASAVFYIFYAGLTRRSNRFLYFCIALISVECLLLYFNHWRCPLAPIAMRYTANRSINFDIYLPKVVAQYNIMFFGTLFFVGVGLVSYHGIKRRKEAKGESRPGMSSQSKP